MADYVFYAGFRGQQKMGGVVTCHFDDVSGKVDVFGPRWEGYNVTYMTTSHNMLRMAVAAETVNGGGLALFVRENSRKPFIFQRFSNLGNVDFSHCYFSWDDRYVFVTDYAHGKAYAYQILPNGEVSLTDEISLQDNGHGPNLLRQEGSHPHSAFQSAATGLIAISDLGADALGMFSLDENGRFIRQTQWKAPTASGPRHVAFSADGKRCYLLTELTSEIIELRTDARGNLTERRIFSSRQNDGNNLASEIHFSADERFLYVGNRGENSIVRFCMGEDGGLFSPAYISTRGWPREFIFSNDGKYMIILNEEYADSRGELEVFSVDQYTGELSDMKINCSLPGAYSLAYGYMLP